MKTISYSTQEQITMFNQAKTGVDLLDTKEIIQEFQSISTLAQIVFDINMNHFLITNSF